MNDASVKSVERLNSDPWLPGLEPSELVDNFLMLRAPGTLGQRHRPPAQRPGRSKQDYATPPEFLDAVKKLLVIEEFAVDVAASKKNAVADVFYTELDNGLAQPWLMAGWHWCNPPFGQLAKWAEKAVTEAATGTRTAFLCPASVGANWWAKFVHNRAAVWFLNGRITFVGEAAPYPKDCALVLFDSSRPPGYGVWRWQ